MIIGTFTLDPQTKIITGELATISRLLPLSLVPNDDKGEDEDSDKPDYFYINGDFEQGAAWWRLVEERSTKKTVRILSVRLDCPFWAAPLQFALWPRRGGQVFEAMWNRNSAKREHKNETA